MKCNRGGYGLRQLGQPDAPSILFPVFTPPYPQGMHMLREPADLTAIKKRMAALHKAGNVTRTRWPFSSLPPFILGVLFWNERHRRSH